MPSVLAVSGPIWTREAVDAVEGAMAEGDEPSYKWKHDQYANPRVTAALKTVFRGKCAFCEARIGHIAPVHVEHYRPKGAVWVDGRNEKPGYYWLGYEWANLLLACPMCNMKKRNHFPVDGPRAQTPGDSLAAEKALLLDPTVDRPTSHLGWDFTLGRVVARNDSPRGRATIRVCALNRDDLVDARRDKLQAAQMALVVLRLAESVGNPALLASSRKEIRRLRAADGEYAGMVRAFISASRTAKVEEVP